ncbi:hypothetical protein C8F04DRAFT_1251879 [Mycena alexandri]|uniref:Uncharacterized protein n=1 Tax=Mycena alexandri TaxID=1745969 RepID=A0AAD6TB76_9AGAR|nr:hypothetical protein C8F04DRAFT_1251879 [Mycena alexandri]
MSFEIVIEQGPGSTVNMMFCNSSAFFNAVPTRAPAETARAFPAPAPQTVPVSAPAPGAEAATTPEDVSAPATAPDNAAAFVPMQTHPSPALAAANDHLVGNLRARRLAAGIRRVRDDLRARLRRGA